jgi:hypothetical protein
MGVAAADFMVSRIYVYVDAGHPRGADPGPPAVHAAHSFASATDGIVREDARSRIGAASLVSSSPSTTHAEPATMSTTPRQEPRPTSTLGGKSSSVAGAREGVLPTVPADEAPLVSSRYDQDWAIPRHPISPATSHYSSLPKSGGSLIEQQSTRPLDINYEATNCCTHHTNSASH